MVAVHAYGHAADRDRPADRVGVRHLAGVAQRHHGGRAGGVPDLYQPLLYPAGFDEPDRLGDAEGRRRRQAHLRHPRPCVERAGAGAPGEAGQGRRRHRHARPGLPLRQPGGDPRAGPVDCSGRDDRAGRAQRLGQKHAGQPDLPLLRCFRRGDPCRRRRHPLAAGVRVPPPYRFGAAGAVPVLRHHRRQHRLRQAGCHARGDHRRRARRACARVHPAPAARL
ncbi:hypothetical protein D9M72_514040 [compost metagenome]